MTLSCQPRIRKAGRGVLLHRLLAAMVCFLLCFLQCDISHAEVLDRVVAYVDDWAITLTEFKETYAKTKENVTNVTEEDVINSMINRLLLLKEAKRIKLEAPNDDALIKEYVEIKIRSSIIVSEDEIRKFYNEHSDEFRGKDFTSVRAEIEKYLYEAQINKELKRHLEELRSHSEIKIQLKNG